MFFLTSVNNNMLFLTIECHLIECQKKNQVNQRKGRYLREPIIPIRKTSKLLQIRENSSAHVVTGSSFEYVSLRRWQARNRLSTTGAIGLQVVRSKNCINNHSQKLGLLHQGLEKEDA